METIQQTRHWIDSTNNKRWLNTYNRLVEYENFHSIIPNNGRASTQSKLYQRLRRWLQYQRERYMKKRLKQWQIDCLEKFDNTIFYDHTIRGQIRCRRHYPSTCNLSTCIKQFIHSIPRVRFIYQYKFSFSTFNHPYVPKSSKSYTEHMILSLVRKSVKLSECNLDARYGTIQRVLAYAIHDQNPVIDTTICPRFIQKQSEDCISPTSFYLNKPLVPYYILELMKRTLANNFSDLLNKLRDIDNKNDVKMLLKDHIYMFDDFHCPKGGQGKPDIISIHDTMYPQPRRTNFSVIFGDKTYHESMKTYTQNMFIYGAAGNYYCSEHFLYYSMITIT